MAAGMEEGITWKVFQHASAVFGALLALFGSILQAIKAHDKAKHHEKRKSEEVDSSLRKDHDFDFQHFRSVRTLWCVVALGTFFAAIGEAVDIFIDK